jgi:hypothetical protein|tara:strand:+ start:391 stop:597 length:207 start_codon:yes stop_codon:yes gene_type:complete
MTYATFQTSQTDTNATIKKLAIPAQTVASFVRALLGTILAKHLVHAEPNLAAHARSKTARRCDDNLVR